MESDDDEGLEAEHYEFAPYKHAADGDFSDGRAGPSGFEISGVNRSHRAKTAYYNATSEKSLSHQEAKLFYQRHQQETLQQANDTQRSLPRASTYSAAADAEATLSRTTSTTSRRSGQGYIPRDSISRVPITDPDISLQSPTLSSMDLQCLEEDLPDIGDDEDRKTAAKPSDDSLDSAMLHTDISPELTAISLNIKKLLGARHKYINLSLQGPHDNPKDGIDWKIQPPPPNPTWGADKARPIGQTSGEENPNNSNTRMNRGDNVDGDRLSPSFSTPMSPSTKPRKPGRDIGEDFKMTDFLPLPGKDESICFELDQSSVYQIYQASEVGEGQKPLIKVPSLREYYMDMDDVQGISSDGPTKSFAYRQLDILEGRFHLYFLVNSYQEMADCKKVPHRDFYNVRKVDTHVHHSACMNQKHLLRFIKSKMKKSPDEIVMFRDKKELTLQQVFESINLTAYDLSIDTLDMHAHTDTFHRFDKFNLKYNPIGESRLREIFLKTDNYIQGRYLAEITKEVISDLESSKYQFVEWRVSIYGRSIDEWDKLSAWIIDNKLVSHNVRWLIQIPRLYSLYKANGQMDSYEQILINIFQPLFEVTKDPSTHANLHVFLQRVVGFDSVDDESKTEVRLYKKYPLPKHWNTTQNPPYTYWIYHLFANMASLNQWRQRRGFNTFVLRPHCGEAGDVDHIAATALCCHSISHGLMLRKVPLLQYIFYLDQIGIAMSPLSNNALFLAYERNPLLKYFKRGLNVSLSTDDPLQFAFTKEPLIEEYSVAAQIYRLSAVDMCELARNSVIQSGFERELKQRWLGPGFDLPGIGGHGVAKSNVPNIREEFRYKTLMQELEMLDRYAAARSPLQPGAGPLQPQPSSTPLPSTTSGTRLSTRTPDSSAITQGPKTHAGPQREPLTRPNPSSSTMMSPSQPNSKSWTDMATPPPRIFPGVVHERSRRGSLRQGSRSEKDLDVLTSISSAAYPPPLSELDEDNAYKTSPVASDGE